MNLIDEPEYGYHGVMKSHSTQRRALKRLTSYIGFSKVKKLLKSISPGSSPGNKKVKPIQLESKLVQADAFLQHIPSTRRDIKYTLLDNHKRY